MNKKRTSTSSSSTYDKRKQTTRTPQEVNTAWIAEVANTNSLSRNRPTVSAWTLSPVSLRPSIRIYIKQIWERRHFIVADARARAFQNTRGTLLGKVWSVTRPFLDSLVYWIIFGILLQTNRGIPNFLGYLVVGVNFFLCCKLPYLAEA